MGTNYYLIEKGSEPCPHCGTENAPRKRHIGKSSAGWCFSLRVYPWDGINDLDDWLPLFAGEIRDEYGSLIDAFEMRKKITQRSCSSWESRKWGEPYPWCYPTEADFHERNNSERGPNGLARHKLSDHCIKHGAGTWDCIVGDYS